MTAIARLLDALLPHDCYACGAHAGRDMLCRDCLQSLPQLPGERCPQCALPSPHGQLCGACLRDAPHYDASLARWAYEFPIREMVQALKYQARLAMAPWMARALADLEPPPEADCLIALPLHPARLAERGFNQSVEIARDLARHWGLPRVIDACVKDRMVEPQAKLPWKARRKNIRGAFRCLEDMSGQRIVVVDDVMTTGATLDEFAKTLKQRGAVHVTNVVIARTLPG
ncbi:MAG: ComF family protein [Sterolibacteriaceae bacterium]|nr:ComF family protein [Sterolibacteriaceae bacterium]MBK9086408.1 ComF family protein [Sterolibacteriaceae bacterium]